MPTERLQKLLAAAGVASRRHSEDLIRAGRVRVDGEVITELGSRADPERQRIDVDGRSLRFATRHTYVLLHKPEGFVTTADDPEGRPTVFDLLPAGPRLFSVGRLDRDSEGLLLLTDDGDLAHRVTHPRFGLEKEYHVWTDAPVAQQLHALAGGVLLEDGKTAPARVAVVSRGRDGVVLSLTLHEGRNRQVRRMLAAVSLPVYRLRRVGIGPLQLGRLAAGEWRPLSPEEVACVQDALASPGDRAERSGEQRANSLHNRH